MSIKTIEALFLGAVLATAASAASLNISPSSGAAGRQVTLTASGFDLDGIGYNTGFSINGGQVGACPPNSRANCSIQINMPFAAPGPQQITASNSAGEIATATYTVAEPHFYITPACGAPGTTVTAHGKFFAVGADAGIRFDGSYVVTGNYPDDSGTFSASFEVPATSDGTYAVTAANSAGNSGAGSFTIPCETIGSVDDVMGPVYRCVANCDAPNPADRTRVPVSSGDPVTTGDRLETGAGGRARMEFADGTQMTISQNTRLTLDDYVYDGNTHAGSEGYTILGGAFSYVSGLIGKQDSRHDIETAYGCIGIRGTWFVTRVNEQTGKQELYLSTGQVTVTPDGTGVSSIFNGPVTVMFDANTVTSSPFVDAEADGVADAVDNCTLVGNPTQLDSDGDGYGNLCDADLNNSGLTTATDFNLLRTVLNQTAASGALAAAADMNGSGLVTATDFNLLRARLNAAPGPSGVH